MSLRNASTFCSTIDGNEGGRRINRRPIPNWICQSICQLERLLSLYEFIFRICENGNCIEFAFEFTNSGFCKLILSKNPKSTRMDEYG